jgi:quercetin dioxygenase-like cupin family protein
MPRPSDKPLLPLDAATLAAIAEALRPAELSSAQRDSMRDRIAARTRTVHTQTVRGGDVEWQSPWPNVFVKVLRQEADSNLQMVLFRIEPGGVVPAHEHTKEEECLVLEGEILIGDHRVAAGDLHIARAGAAHGDITTQTGALVMVRSEIPPQYLQKLLAAR